MEVVKKKARAKVMQLRKEMHGRPLSRIRESELSKKMKAAFIQHCGDAPAEYADLIGKILPVLQTGKGNTSG